MNVQVKPHALTAERHLPFECVALVLQGGGVLGAYQAGVYEALAEAGIHPDWTAGISIGAINAAIIAGNLPNSRVDRLRELNDGLDHNTLRLVTITGNFGMTLLGQRSGFVMLMGCYHEWLPGTDRAGVPVRTVQDLPNCRAPGSRLRA
jgi:predicted acylesterase/phospholipase RssA